MWEEWERKERKRSEKSGKLAQEVGDRKSERERIY